MKSPLDLTNYEPDRRSRPLEIGAPDGRYVYVQDEDDVIWAVPDDQPHLHPKVLGHARPARFAGDLTIEHGKIVDLTNCSGTFQFDDAAGLIAISRQLRHAGWEFARNSVKLFSYTISQRPLLLNDNEDE